MGHAAKPTLIPERQAVMAGDDEHDATLNDENETRFSDSPILISLSRHLCI
jgi:hypothetical protein